MKTISKERWAEIEAFEETFTDPECPPLTDEQLAQLRPSRLRGTKDLSYRIISDDEELPETSIEVPTTDAVMV